VTALLFDNIFRKSDRNMYASYNLRQVNTIHYDMCDENGTPGRAGAIVLGAYRWFDSA
jgi:hypothetical protein